MSDIHDIYDISRILQISRSRSHVNTTDELIKEFEDVILEESKLIRNESIVALKHVTTGKYLSSIKNLRYTTGSKTQLVFVGNSNPDSNSLWKIKFNNELATYGDTFITFQHIKSNKFLGRYNWPFPKEEHTKVSSTKQLSYWDKLDRDGRFNHSKSSYKSPLTQHTEVSCIDQPELYWDDNWKFNHSKLINHQGYLKSNDTINLSIKQRYTSLSNQKSTDATQQIEFLRSHYIQFNDTFQEVFCHNDRLGGNDEWCIELISLN